MFYFCSMPAGPAHSDLQTAVARAQRLLALLGDLSEMGMDLVRDLHRRAMAGAGPADAASQYCRLAKAIRQLVALEMRLAQALEDAESGRWAAEEAERELRALTAKAREDAALEAVEEALRDAGDGEAVERLRERLDDWRSDRAVERDFTDKSVTDIVMGACHAMGLDPDPHLLTDQMMSQTLADAVRAYAAALAASADAAQGSTSPRTRSPPPTSRPNALAHARPPPL
jgi:hypothetical protein